MITSKGIGILLVAILVFLLARVTQVGWLYLVDALLWGILILSAVLPWLGVVMMSARLRLDIEGASAAGVSPSEGDRIRIQVSLRNRAFWPRFVFGLYYDCPLVKPESCLRRFFVTQLAASAQMSLVSILEAYQRGPYHLGPVVVESSAPFGLFRRRAQLCPPQPVLVLPKVHKIRQCFVVDELCGVVLQSRGSRVGTDPVGSRNYLPGDPRRYIHWRNTARVGRVMVREFEDPKEEILYLLFDAIQVWGEGRDTTLEYGIKIAVSAADYARRKGIRARLWGGGLRSKAAAASFGDDMIWPDLLKNLALVAPGDGDPLAEAVKQLPLGSIAIVAVSAADGQSIGTLAQVAPSLRGLAVVLLEGFGEPPAEGVSLRSLEAAGISLVRCKPGMLPEALQALEQLATTPSLMRPR